MSEIRVVVSGTGRMGREVATAVMAEPGMEAVAYVDGISTRESLDGLPVFGDAVACFAQTGADVVVDFTNAAWTPGMCEAALAAGVRPVIGTTGLTDEFMTWLEAESAAAGQGAVVAANFAIGAVLMMHFAKIAAPFFENAEVIELHHDQKVDAPSGTAKTTAEMMRAARDTDFTVPETELETVPGTRGGTLGGVTLHSVRLPGLVANQQVLFGGLGQTLTIRHDTTGRDSFMPGVVAAVRWVMASDRLVVGLENVLGIGD